MTALRSLVFNVLFFSWSLVVQVASLPALLLPRRATMVAGRLWVRVSLALLSGICGLGHEIRGRKNLPPGACIVASKHQSAWDTLIFSQILDDPSYVLKRELILVPLFGWYLRKARVVPIDRSAGAKALRGMVAAARRVIAEGRPLVIYPEGTRSAPGEQRAYLPGVAALYLQLDVPLVPVALNSGLFWARRGFLKRPGRVILEILPPIPPGLPRKTVLAKLQAEIEGTSERLRLEALAARGEMASAAAPAAPQSENKPGTST